MKVYNTGETEESLRATYNPDGSDLRRGQLIMLDMLKYIDGLCKEHGIEYRLDSGNVLGAVRHGGFIPWDDDVDIALFRKDYFKLYKVLKETKHERFVLQDGKTDPNYYLYYYKLRDMKSHILSYSNSIDKLKYDGFQIDIFPMIKGPIPFLIKATTYLDNHFVSPMRLKNRYVWYVLHRFLEIFVHPVFRFMSFLFGNKNIVGYDYGVHALQQVTLRNSYPYRPIHYEGVLLMGPTNPVDYCEEMYSECYNELPSVISRNHHQIDDLVFD